jgi:hypothetical protein
MPIALPEPYLEVRRVSRLEFETVENNTKIAFAQERPDCASTIGNGKSLLLPLRHRHPGYSRAKSLEEHLARHHTVGVLQALVVPGKFGVNGTSWSGPPASANRTVAPGGG